MTEINLKILYNDLIEIFQHNNINVEFYFKRNLPFIRVLKKLYDLEKPYKYELIINHFIISNILMYERKKLPANKLNKIFSYLLDTIFNLSRKDISILKTFNHYYNFIKDKKFNHGPYKRDLKTFDTYISYLEKKLSIPYAFTSYIAGLSLKIGRMDANIMSKFGMYYSIFLIISWEIKNPRSNIFFIDEFKGKDHLDKLHSIGNRLDYYYKVAEDVIGKIEKKSLKIFLLYELTDFLGEVYNIITNDF